MWTDLVVVSAPSLAFPGRVVEAHEPVGAQALCPELGRPKDSMNALSGMVLSVPAS
jgi:hypothetical protein